jgi:Kef-type K+ transport system membrane component KefB/nucleotide-binding universal stress UspA family protein
MDNMSDTTGGGLLNGHGPFQLPLYVFFVQVMVRSLKHTLADRFNLKAALILFVTRLLTLPFSKLGQPTVIAEVVGGILLGPSALGHIPGFSETLFPEWSLGFLETVSELGLVLYLFLVGLELDVRALWKNKQRWVAISVGGVALPFALGAAASVHFYSVMLAGEEFASGQLSPPPFSSFLLFTGIAMSITAFPVLARILTELNLLSTRVGLMTISAAAIDDVISWSLLGLVVTLIKANGYLTALYVLLLAVAFTLVVTLVVQPLYLKAVSYAQQKGYNQLVFGLTLILTFICAWITDLIGIHSLFGAFLFGLSIPSDMEFALHINSKMEDIVTNVFIPIYFTISGLKTRIQSLSDPASWGVLALALVVATGGKILGCSMFAKWGGLSNREAVSVGVLMNTKGLFELIVLNIGLGVHVIDQRLFSIFVVMALLTTLMTTPLINIVYPPYTRKHIGLEDDEDGPPARPYSEGALSLVMPLPVGSYHLLIHLSKIEDISSLANLIPLFHVTREQDQLVLYSIRHKQSDLTSNILYATQTTAAIKVDPVLNMMNVFGNLLRLPVSPHLSVGNQAAFMNELSLLTRQEAINLLLIPYQKSSLIASSNDSYLRQMTSAAKCTVAFYIDASAGHILNSSTSLSPKRILVPFVGGISARQSLVLALRFANHENIRVDVLCLSKSDQPAHIASETTIIINDMDAGDLGLLASISTVAAQKNLDFDIEYKYNVGHFDEAIVEACNSRDYELILLAYNNKSKEQQEDSILGSLADSVLEQVKKTSLLVLNAEHLDMSGIVDVEDLDF